MLSLQGEERDQALEKLRTCLEEGKYDDEIQQELCYSPEVIKELRVELIEQESTAIQARSTEETYALFVFEQRKCIADLDKIISDFEDSKQQQHRNINGYVGAIRTKSEIIDKILEKGQTLGLIPLKTASQGMVAGQPIYNLTDIELKQFIIVEMKAGYEMLKEFGDQDIKELDPGPLHQQLGPPKEPIKAHTRNAVFAGRRVVRGKEE